MAVSFSLQSIKKVAANIMLAATAYVAGASPLHAITFSFDYDEEDRPAFDPNGTELRRIVTSAGQIWSDYLGGVVAYGPNGQPITNYHFDLRWENIDGTTLGQHQPGWLLDSRDLVFDTVDPSGNPRNWFFDPTPFENSEYTMQQTLVRDMNPVAADNAFAGSPPALLEVGFSGDAIAANSIGNIDLLTAVLHEMGHMIGFNWNPNDGDYDFASSTIGGRNVGVNEADGMHGGGLESLMHGSLGASRRRLPSATDILAMHDEASLLTFDIPRQDFLGEHSTNWQDTLNWVGGAVPNGDNQVFVRHGGSAMMSANGSAAALRVSDNSQIFVNNHSFRVFGDTKVGEGFGSDGRLHVGTLLPGPSRFETERLTIHTGIVNLQNAEAVLDVNGAMNIEQAGTLMGAGRTEVGGLLTNNGEINAGAFLLFGFGGELAVAATGAGRLDLDGSSPVEGGRISAVNGNLRIAGPLADDFNGTATVGAGRTMAFHHAWKNHGTLALRGGQSASNAATLAGPGTMTFDGVVEVDGFGVIAAPLVLNGPSRVRILDANDQLTLAGPTTLRGVTFEGAGSLGIAGVTNVHLPNPLLPDQLPTVNAPFLFFGAGGLGDVTGPIVGVFDTGTGNPDGVATTFPTTYSFPIPVTVKSGGALMAYGSSISLPRTTTMAGGRLGGLHLVNQIGDLVVEQSSVINPTTFLWGVDAPSHKTTIRSGARLDLTPRQIVRSGSDNVYRGELNVEPGARLHVDLGDATSWRFAGQMALSPGATVSGDNLINTGDIRGNGSFLVNRFENSGRVAPGRIFGGLQMPGANFVQMAGGVLESTLGDSLIGNDAGLITAGAAQLGGTLALSLVNGFVPTVGEEFDVLRAASISGVFANLSLSGPLGNMFTGELLYRPDRVTFRITGATMTADFNGDGVVDGTDLLHWKLAVGTRGDRGAKVAADATGDGFVDGSDVLAWQRQLGLGGRSLPIGGRFSVGAVPEPATFGLAIAACGVILYTSRRN